MKEYFYQVHYRQSILKLDIIDRSQLILRPFTFIIHLSTVSSSLVLHGDFIQLIFWVSIFITLKIIASKIHGGWD